MNRKLIFNNTLIAIIITSLLIVFSCEKDDVCIDVPITPLLVISFRDNNPNIDDVKTVQSLQIRSLDVNDSNGDPKAFFEVPVTDTIIRIPLATFKDSTRYEFTRNFGNENTTIIDSDIIEFTYSRDNEFVNRACGFRTTFSNLNIIKTTSNWISGTEILNPIVNEETAAHINLFH